MAQIFQGWRRRTVAAVRPRARTLFTNSAMAARLHLGWDHPGCRPPRWSRVRRGCVAALRSTGRSRRGAAAVEKHCQTGERCLDDLLKSFLARAKFNQGFAPWSWFLPRCSISIPHQRPPASRDVARFEKARGKKIGMPTAIALRHRRPSSAISFRGHYALAITAHVVGGDGRRRLRRLQGRQYL